MIAKTFFKWHINKDRIDYDLQPVSIYKPPYYVVDDIHRIARKQDIWVSILFHTNRYGRYVKDYKIAHGFILSDMDDYLIDYYTTGPTWKSVSVVVECLPYIVLLTSDQEVRWEYNKRLFYKARGIK